MIKVEHRLTVFYVNDNIVMCVKAFKFPDNCKHILLTVMENRILKRILFRVFHFIKRYSFWPDQQKDYN